jgi:hypothetical protein
VLRALAVGYVVFLSVESELSSSPRQKSAKGIWDFTVQNFRSNVLGRFNVADELRLSTASRASR